MMNKKGPDLTFFTSESVEFRAEDVDISNSYMDLDQSENAFKATLDRICFESIPDIVTKVLSNRGYHLNIENILASLDQAKFGVYSKNPNASQKDGKKKLNSYQYCLKLGFPSKNSSGSLLKLFYDEIAQLELELLKLKSDKVQLEKEHKKESLVKLKQNIKELKNENTHLKEQIRTLKKIQTTLSQAQSPNVQLEELPIMETGKGEFRLALVLSNWVDEQFIKLRFDQGSFSYPLAKLAAVPALKSQVLCYLVENRVKQVFVFQEQESFQISVGKVLFYQDYMVKIIDHNRNYKILSTSNRIGLNQRLKRGQSVLIYTYRDRLIKFSPIPQNNQKQWLNHLSEVETIQSINQKNSQKKVK
jgi:hypothetical protein